jgi:pimeloyl-ACP methyl ester carboxylesterase
MGIGEEVSTECAEIDLHGRRLRYRIAGKGSLVVILHGIAGSSATWDKIIPRLEAQHTVIAPDLLGHGESAKPSGDYSLGAYANLIRDLLEALGQGPGTIVGHSLGGGVALQFAYQFPERCERLVLVSSGGLGREVHAILRAAALPGGGQHVSAEDKLYLSEGMPTMIVWGDRDPLIPVAHALRTQQLIPGSRLEIFPGAGHYPYLEDPERFATLLLDFIRTTKPTPFDAAQLRTRLKSGRPLPPATGGSSISPGSRPQAWS